MSKEEIESLARELRPLVKVVGLVRTLIGACCVCVAGIVGGALWVANQTQAIAANTDNVHSIIEDRKKSLEDWTAWRREKDANDTRFATLLENQQKLLENQQRMIERIDARR